MRRRMSIVWIVLVVPTVFGAPPPPPCSDDPAPATVGGIARLDEKSRPQAVAAGARLDALLQYVSPDAALVIVVADIEGLGSSFADFAGVIHGRPPGNLASDLIQRHFPYHAKWINSRGPGAIVVMDSQGEPIAIATASDDFTPASIGAGVVELKNAFGVIDGDQAFVAFATDGIVVRGPNRADVERVLAALPPSAPNSAQALKGFLKNHHVGIIANPRRWRAEIDRTLMIAEQIIQQGVLASGEDSEVGLAVWKDVFEKARHCTDELQSYVAAVRVEKQGIHYSDRLQWSREGEIAKRVRAIEPTSGELLRGLPDNRFAFCYASEWKVRAGSISINEELHEQLFLTAAIRERLGPERFEASRGTMKRAYDSFTGMSSCIGLNRAKKGMAAHGLYLSAKADESRDAIRESLKLTPKFAADFGDDVECTIECEGIKMGAFSGDACRLSFKGDSTAIQKLEVLYGAEPTYSLASHRDGVAYAFGAKTVVNELLPTFYETPGSPLSKSPRVRRCLDSLSPNPQLLVLVDAGQLLEFVGYFAESFGVPQFPFRFADPDSVPLIGMACYSDAENAFTHSEIVLPAETIAQLARAFGD